MSTAVTVLQTTSPSSPPWLWRCLASVRRWAASRGFGYRLLGDEIFAIVPPDWIADAGPERLPRTDYGRLLWIDRLLRNGADRVLWLDSDVLMIDDLELPDGDALCRELWVWQDGERIRAEHRVSNCAMLFERGSPLLSAYLVACARAPSAGPLDRLALGPALLTRLAARRALPLIGGVATLSPLLMADTAAGGTLARDLHARAWLTPLTAAHLCRSLGRSTDGPDLTDPALYDRVVERLEAGEWSSTQSSQA